MRICTATLIKRVLKETTEEMRKTEFDYMWEDSVHPLIKMCDEQLDTNYKAAVALKIKNLDEYKAELRELYRHKRDWLKKEYLPYEKKATLDFHKLSAVMCRCIIGNKPFVFDQNIAEQYLKQSHNERQHGRPGCEILRDQIDTIYVNYKLAFLVGESIAFYDLVQWAQRQIAYIQKEPTLVAEPEKTIRAYELFIKKMDESGILSDYEWVNKRHDPFFESMVSCLIKNDILKRDFDYLFFAANMFQWQEYTKQILFNEILSDKAYDSLSLIDMVRGQDEDALKKPSN